MKHVLLINTILPKVHQNYDYVMSVVGKKFIAPPLSLLTIAASIPDHYEVKLIDMNVNPLDDESIRWADLVFITGITMQHESMMDVAARIFRSGVYVVMGGMHIFNFQELFHGVAQSFICGEAEDILAEFFHDFEHGTPKKVYVASDYTDMTRSPCPRYDLIDVRDYYIAVLQYSRGCPHGCDFCLLGTLYGRKTRAKKIGQFIAELDMLYETGFEGILFLGDDNFHQNADIRELLVGMADWQKKHGYPFVLLTQTDISLSQDDSLIKLMVDAGFEMVQIGIESPSISSLDSVHKRTNRSIDLLDAVKKIHRHHLEVLPAMLVGMDGDPEDICDRQFSFLQKAGTPSIMLSLLRAIKGTELYSRLEKSNRLLGGASGDQTGDISLNFIPTRDPELILNGFASLLRKLYDPRNYFQRCLLCIKDLGEPPRRPKSLPVMETVKLLIRYVTISGITRYNYHFLKFILLVGLTRPKMLERALRHGILGYHFFRMSQVATIGYHGKHMVGTYPGNIVKRTEGSC